MSVNIRPAQPDERAAIRDLTLAAYAPLAERMTPAAWAGLAAAVRQGLEADAERFVAERRGALVGSVMLFSPAVDAYGTLTGGADVPELRLLAVADAEQGKGVGRALVEACAKRARALGARALGLHTSESLLEARHLYAKMGFVRVPERDFRPPGAELVEAYELPL